MPCRDGREDTIRTEYITDPELIRENGMLTEFLCTIGRDWMLEKPLHVTPELVRWWAKHAAEDAKVGDAW